MWLKNFINEWKCWRIVRKTFLQHKAEFDAMKIRSDWFGRLVVIINRYPEIELGSEEDEIYLHNETTKLSLFLAKMGLLDILAYDLKPMEDETIIDKHTIEYAHGYIIEFTPAYDLSKQYVTIKSVLGIFASISALIGGIIYGVSLLL